MVLDGVFVCVEAVVLARLVVRVRVVFVVLVLERVAVLVLLLVRLVPVDVFDTESVAEFSTAGFS